MSYLLDMYPVKNETKYPDRSIVDSLIAATALHQELIVVTENVEDFERMGVVIANPWQSHASTF